MDEILNKLNELHNAIAKSNISMVDYAGLSVRLMELKKLVKVMTPAERQDRLLERIAIALEGIRENTREKTWEENRSQWEISPGEIPPSTICKKCYGK